MGSGSEQTFGMCPSREDAYRRRRDYHRAEGRTISNLNYSHVTAMFDGTHDLCISAGAAICRGCINTVLEDQRPRCRGVGPSEQPQQIHVGGTLWKPPSSSCQFEFADRPAHLEPNAHDSCLLDHALQR